jgi:MFS family permease
MLFTARTAHAGTMITDPATLTKFLTRLGSASAFIEFLINPIFGKLSDSYGRRPIMPVGNIAVAICR